MKIPGRFVFLILSLSACVVAFALASVSVTADARGQDNAASSFSVSSSSYAVHNLVSDGGVPADHTDADLVNPWGLVFNPTAVAWVANNETGVSTLYDGAGVKQSLVVTIPPPPNGAPPSHPTGIVFSGGSDFVVTVGMLSGPSRFIFSTEDGTISAWAPAVDPTHAILKVNNSAHEAIYKGLALAGNGTGHFLYATDFHHARIDVFDASFNPVSAPGGFHDPRIPRGYAPFGIQNILGNLYVTYAKQDDDKEDDVAGQGFGFVNVFDANGTLIRRLVTRGVLNAPWGLALAPADFGGFRIGFSSATSVMDASTPSTCARVTSRDNSAQQTTERSKSTACGRWCLAMALPDSQQTRSSLPLDLTTRNTAFTAGLMPSAAVTTEKTTIKTERGRAARSRTLSHGKC